jgi:hypothetical protein
MINRPGSDLSVEETREVLTNAPIRFVDYDFPEVFYRDDWWPIGRVDLFNQLCTGIGWPRRSADENALRQLLAEKNLYGARLRFGRNPKTFAIVDRLTDG